MSSSFANLQQGKTFSLVISSPRHLIRVLLQAFQYYKQYILEQLTQYFLDPIFEKDLQTNVSKEVKLTVD
jgi:hypothetical protein